MTITVLGVYPVEEAEEPSQLIEVLVKEHHGDLNMGEFTQEVPGQPHDNWQVPWDEHILNSEGTSGELAPFPGPLKVHGSQRVAFFLHYLDGSLPLITPDGPVMLPEESARPTRLAFIQYQAPD